MSNWKKERFENQKKCRSNNWKMVVSTKTKEVFWFPEDYVSDVSGEKFLWLLLQQKLPFETFPNNPNSTPWGWNGCGQASLDRQTMNWWKRVYSLFPHMIGFRIVRKSSESWVHHERISDTERGTGGPFCVSKISPIQKFICYELLSNGLVKRYWIEENEFSSWNKYFDRHVAGTCSSSSGASLICDNAFYWIK